MFLLLRGKLGCEPNERLVWQCSLLLQGKLGLDRGVRLENLMVSHFLSALDRLADPALLQFVKHLQSRAQGEVRSANERCCGSRA